MARKIDAILGQIKESVMEMDDLPTPGEVLTNQQISRRFVVGVMGGMRRSTQRNLLVLISDPFKGLYQDRWEADVLHYTGMGPAGHQDQNYAQNRTLADSPISGIPVHLLEALEPRKYTYVGQVKLVSAPYQESQLDSSGAIRSVWMFPVQLKVGAIPPLTKDQARKIEECHAQFARRLSTAELRERAIKATKRPAMRMVKSSAFVRDAAVSEYVKRLAEGHCDLCNSPAPFVGKDKQAYLECHHIAWLAKGGDDTITNTVALCPNCHRKMHIVNHPADQATLKNRAIKRDRELE